MHQAHTPAVVATRLEELLSTIDASAAELKKFLVQQAQSTQVGTDLKDTSSRSLYPFYADPTVASHASLVKLACERLITLVTPPHVSVMEQSTSFFTTVAMSICMNHDVARHIQDLSSDDRGAPLEEVADAAMLDQELLGRVLRYLSQRGTFQEDGPARFKNTTTSLTLTNDAEFKAFMSLLTTECRDASSKLGTYLQEKYRASKTTSDVQESLPSPFNMYSGLPLYQWLHQPENILRSQNFNQAMRGVSKCESLFSIPADYPFSDLPPNTTIVDVGGGIGALAETILPECPHLKMVVQDMEPVIKSAVEKPSDTIKQLMDNGRLRFEAQDFFKDQKETSRGNAFLLCNVLLNQSDDDSLRILQCIRKSDPSKLIIIDRFYGPFFPVEANTSDGEREIYGAIRKASRSSQKTAGRPSSQAVSAVFDMLMATMFATKTRTQEQWTELLARAGYEVVSVTPVRASSGHVVIDARIRS
ncbi:S-adenosyl-L-methionine-dependent methyltransferase [Panaeolus papilionaceus]|nr:S-adenosyl-L-methionine-dependent methyltransferase [Panaeolus papilionaceus]